MRRLSRVLAFVCVLGLMGCAWRVQENTERASLISLLRAAGFEAGNTEISLVTRRDGEIFLQRVSNKEVVWQLLSEDK